MKAWSERPFEVRNLYNPAFCGLLLARAVAEYQKEQDRRMPYSLSFLVLPFVLHRASREILAAKIRSRFLKVLGDAPELLIDFPARAVAMRPFTQEGFGLLMQKGCLDVSEDGRVSLRPNSVVRTVKGSDEAKQCQSVALYLGRHFARVDDRATLFASLGVRP